MNDDDIIKWEAVQATCTDAAECKASAAAKGYITDPYINAFLKPNGPASRRTKHHRRRLPPLIHRGYYARVSAIDKLISQFIAAHKEPVQIVSLGAGHDTTYFRHIWPRSVVSKYVEIDFENITASKIRCMNHYPELFHTILNNNTTNISQCEIRSEQYTLLGMDLTNSEYFTKLASVLQTDVPTLWISECVLIYMDVADSKALLTYVSTTYSSSTVVLYEQILPNDAFGETMVSNLNARGCSLRSIHTFPTIESQIHRLESLGFKSTKCFDMNDIYYKFLEKESRMAQEKLEIFDELEEFHLIQAHYCIVVASTNDTKECCLINL